MTLSREISDKILQETLQFSIRRGQLTQEKCASDITFCEDYFSAEGCKDDNCVFLHPLKHKIEAKEVEPCSICYEIPKRFGFQEACKHYFCAPCAESWKRAKGFTICPLCRSITYLPIYSDTILSNAEKELIAWTRNQMLEQKSNALRSQLSSVLNQNFNESRQLLPFGIATLAEMISNMDLSSNQFVFGFIAANSSHNWPADE